MVGTVFVDANDDGALSAGEVGLAGQTVYLDVDGSGTLTASDPSAVTTGNGTFTIANVPVGAYTLRQVVPTGYTQTLPTAGGYAITVTTGAAAAAPAFGDYLPASNPATPTPTLPPATLSAAVLTAPAARVIGGTVATTKVRVANSAAALFAGPVTVAIYASPDGTLSSSAVLAGSVAGQQLTLKPGRSATVAVRFTYPASLPSGTYRLVAAVTPTSAVASSAGAALTQPATAVAPRAVAVAAPAVRLSVSLPPTKVRQGRSAVVAVRVANAGNTVAVGPVNVTLYASATGVVDARSTVLNTAGAPVNLKPGKAAVIRVSFTAPPSLVPGSYKLIAVITSATTPADDTAADDTAVAATR